MELFSGVIWSVLDNKFCKAAPLGVWDEKQMSENVYDMGSLKNGTGYRNAKKP